MNTAKLNDFQRTEFPARIAALEAREPGFADAWTRLEGVLLPAGGHAVVPQEQNLATIEMLVANGVMEQPRHVRAAQMRRNSCHANACRLWAQSAGNEKIWTGYAFAGDGLWRQHSWVNDGHGIIETTVTSLIYFGVELSFPQSFAWALDYCEEELFDAASADTPFGRDVEALLDVTVKAALDAMVKTD
jgi:hypothetical protein